MIEWVMLAEGVSFRHAVEPLRGGPLPSSGAEQAAALSAPPCAGRPRQSTALPTIACCCCRW